MKRRGVDSIYSWVVAVSCGVVYFVVGSPTRLGSLLFVEMIDRYGTNRKDASLPFALAYLLRSVSGPFAGFFGHKFGLQQVTMFGCVLSSVGVGLCFFSEEIISIDIFLGILYGSGFGWASCLVPEIINQHFVKHRAKGYGVILGLSGVLNVVSPSILDKIIKDYGVSGSFLIMSSVSLMSVPAAMLLVKPEERSPSMKNKTNSSSRKKDSLPAVHVPHSYPDFATASGLRKVLKPRDGPSSKRVANHQSISNFEEPVSSAKQHSPIGEIKCSEQCEIISEIRDKRVTSLTSKELALENGMDKTESGEEKLTEENDQESGNKKGSVIENRDKKQTGENCLDIINRRHKEGENDIIESRDNKLKEELNLDLIENNVKKLTKNIETKIKNKNGNKIECKTINIFWNPVFLFVTFIQSSHFYVMYIFWTVTADLVRDKNLPQYLEVYFVTALALLDTVGRSALGFVTDSGYMSVRNFSALCFILMGLSCVLLVFVSGFPMTMTAICIFGFMCGTNLTVLPGIVTEFFEKEKRTMAMASRLILSAPMSFTMSPLIGYFRGTLGTYNGLLYVMAALCTSCSIVLLFLPRLKKHTEQIKKKWRATEPEIIDCQ